MFSARFTPRLRDGLEIRPPLDEGARWMVVRPSGPPLRIGDDVVRLLTLLDGTANVEELASRLGEPWTAADVSLSLRRFAELELLAGSEVQRARRARRVTFVPPATVRFVISQAPALPAKLARATRAIPRGTGEAVLLSVGVVGLIAIILLSSDILVALTRPVPVTTLLIVVAIMLVGTVLHELAHAVALARRGGVVGAFGVMLFYLVPAAFADVTDMWRLPNRRDRLSVALAGISVQAGIAGAAAWGALSTVGDARTTFTILALASYVSAVMNACPFVKLDGYVAVLAYTNSPRLRDRSMTAARHAFEGILWSVRPGRMERVRPLFVAFGIASALAPIIILSVVVVQLAAAVSALGAAGKLIVLGVGAYLVGYAAWGVVRWLRDGARAGVGRSRLTITAAVFVVLLIGVAFLPVDRTVRAGFATGEGGETLLVHPDRSVLEQACGDTVELRTNGLVASVRVGDATVVSCSIRRVNVPIDALVPIRTDTEVPAYAAQLKTDLDFGDVPMGSASIQLGTVPLYRWAWEW